jgi:hypothetical protein
LASTIVNAQQRQLIDGSISAGDSLKNVSGARITNVTTQTITASNMLGNFTISAATGDSLLVSKDGYALLGLRITETSFLSLKLSKTTMLNNVTIIGLAKKQEQTEVVNEYRSKGIYYNGKPPLSAYLPVGGQPLTVLHELFGTAVKREKRFMKFAANERRAIEIDRRFNPAIVSANTGLKGDTLSVFMDKYRPEYDALKKMSDYDLVLFIKKSFELFKKNENNGAVILPFKPELQ